MDRAARFAGNESNRSTYFYEADNDLDVLTQLMNTTTVTLDYGHNNAGQITGIAANDDFYLPKPTVSFSHAYVPDKLNRYSSVKGTAATYDNNGNLLTRYPLNGTTKDTFTYDSENRLVTAAVNGSSTATISYDYDALGRRVKKTVGSTVTQYLLDGDEEIAELNSTGTVLRRYITGPAIDDRIARVEGSSTAPSTANRFYYRTNHQGSVVATTDATGTVTQRLAYDEYGLLGQGGVSSGEQFRYTGRRYDPETNLYYYRARYYAPDIGRFLQVDPIGYGDDLNLYSYVGNDPANKTDPSGNCVWDLCIVEGAATAALIDAVIVTAVVGGTAATVAYNESQNSPGAPPPSNNSQNNQAGNGNGNGNRNGESPPPPANKWKVGDDPNAATRSGNAPSRQTVARREWKNEAANPTRSDFTKQDMQRMESGKAPQRMNPNNPRNGGVESMERSHEPVPKRDGGTQTVPRWPEEHQAVDPCRYTGYCK